MALAENQTRQPMDRMVNPERVSIIYILPIIYKGSEHPQWRKDNVYNKRTGKTGLLYAQNCNFIL